MRGVWNGDEWERHIICKKEVPVEDAPGDRTEGIDLGISKVVSYVLSCRQAAKRWIRDSLGCPRTVSFPRHNECPLQLLIRDGTRDDRVAASNRNGDIEVACRLREVKLTANSAV